MNLESWISWISVHRDAWEPQASMVQGRHISGKRNHHGTRDGLLSRRSNTLAHCLSTWRSLGSPIKAVDQSESQPVSQAAWVSLFNLEVHLVDALTLVQSLNHSSWRGILRFCVTFANALDLKVCRPNWWPLWLLSHWSYSEHNLI